MTRRPHENLALIRRVLGENFLELRLERLFLEEDVETNACKVRVEMSEAGKSQSERLVVENAGVGLIDALFHGLLRRYSAEYGSLNSIAFAGFSVRARLDTKKVTDGADSVGEVVLDVRNSEGRLFEFADASRSISSSSAKAVLAAVEYFVNAERAYVTVYRGLKEAQERGREDLIAKYTAEIAEIVKSTSYAEVIEKIRRELT